MDIKGNFEWVCCLVQAVQASYNTSEFSDLSIRSNDRVFLVNSLVLASQSDVLKDIVTGTYPESTLEELFDPYTAESVDSFIRSLYNGSLEEPLLFSDHLLLYRLSRTFQVDWLTSDITLLIKIGVSHATVFSTLSMALEMSDPSLTHASHDILSRTYLNDVSSPTESTWWELDSELVEHVLRMTTLRVCTEIDVFVHVLYWVERNISLTNREECVQVLQSVRIFSLPHIFRESFLFPYISIISQKFFLALKYPQLNRWKVNLPALRCNVDHSAEMCTEFTLSVLDATGNQDYCREFYNSGCRITLSLHLSKLIPFSITIDAEQKFERCYVWFKTEDACGVFPLGEKSVILATVSHDGTILCNALDHIELRRLFSGMCVRIGFALYKLP